MNQVIRCTNYEHIDEKIICEVLLSTYNGEQYVEKQIESILNQKGIKTKLLIRDDGSTDKTVDILEGLKVLHPDQISIIKGTNIGIHKSFAELLKHSNGFDFVAFSDQDDYWDEDKLAIGVFAMIRNGANFYSCSSRLVDDELKPLKSQLDETKKYIYYMCGNSKVLTPGAQGCTIIIDRSLVNLLNVSDYPDYYGHDTWITVVAYCLNKSIYDPIPHMSYRQHNCSWTGNREKKISQFFRQLKFFIAGMKRYKCISKDLLQRYKDILDEAEIQILCLLKDENIPFIKKVKGWKRYHFGKYGLFENIFFLMKYFFYWN